MLPSPAELSYFVEVSHALNFSRAAERLSISQPSLSLAIKRLEATMGTTLFIRHKHGVTLTQAGKKLLLHVRQFIEDWESIKVKALATHETIQGRFTIGCNAVIAIYLVSKFLPPLLEKYPQLDIQLEHAISQKITEQVIALTMDIGLVINPVKHPDLIIRKLGIDETRFWVGPGKNAIQDMQSENAVLLCNPDSMQVQALLKKCKKLNVHFNRVVKSQNLEVIANLCAHGAGIAILPERVAQSLYPNKLKPIAKLPHYSDELCLIYRHENRQIKAMQAIIQAIIAVIS